MQELPIDVMSAELATFFDEKNKEEKVEISEIAEINYEEYIVENGDTLAAICKSRYGSLSKMKEMKEEIKNREDRRRVINCVKGTNQVGLN